jgi:hypothetical protein
VSELPVITLLCAISPFVAVSKKYGRQMANLLSRCLNYKLKDALSSFCISLMKNYHEAQVAKLDTEFVNVF